MTNYINNELKTYKEGLKYVKIKNLALDIGACTGLWTEWMSKDFSEVIAFEPACLNWKELSENFKEKINIKVINMAIGNESSTVELWNSAGKMDKISGHWTLKKPLNIECRSQFVECIKLDNYHFNPNYIKIDAQGSEIDILMGAARILRESSPILNIETTVNGKHNPKIKKLLSTMGYKSVKQIYKHEIFQKC